MRAQQHRQTRTAEHPFHPQPCAQFVNGCLELTRDGGLIHLPCVRPALVACGLPGSGAPGAPGDRRKRLNGFVNQRLQFIPGRIGSVVQDSRRRLLMTSPPGFAADGIAGFPPGDAMQPCPHGFHGAMSTAGEFEKVSCATSSARAASPSPVWRLRTPCLRDPAPVHRRHRHRHDDGNVRAGEGGYP